MKTESQILRVFQSLFYGIVNVGVIMDYLDLRTLWRNNLNGILLPYSSSHMCRYL